MIVCMSIEHLQAKCLGILDIHHAGELGVFVQRNKYATTNLENAIKDVLRRRGETAHDHDDAMQFRIHKGLCRA